MKGLAQASAEDVARAAMDELEKLGIDSELDRERKVAKGYLKLSGEVVANLWDGTPIERFGFVSEGIDHVRLVDPGYLSDAPGVALEGATTAKELASAAAKAHDAWVAKLTDLDVDLARLKLGHKLHGSRGLYVVNRQCGKRKVEFGVRPDGMVEILGIDGTSVINLAPADRSFPFVKPANAAELEAVVEEHADALLSGSRNGSGRLDLLVRFRDREHLRAHLEGAIKRGGLFVEWEGSATPGAPVRLRIEIPGKPGNVEAEGEVVVVLGRDEAAKKNRRAGVGIKLTASIADVQKAVEDLLLSR